MDTAFVAALPPEFFKFRIKIAEALRLDPGDVEGAEARCVHDIALLIQIEKLRLPRRIFPPLGLPGALPGLHPRLRMDQIDEGGFSDAGGAGEDGALSAKEGEKLLPAVRPPHAQEPDGIGGSLIDSPELQGSLPLLLRHKEVRLVEEDPDRDLLHFHMDEETVQKRQTRGRVPEREEDDGLIHIADLRAKQLILPPEDPDQIPAPLPIGILHGRKLHLVSDERLFPPVSKNPLRPALKIPFAGVDIIEAADSFYDFTPEYHVPDSGRKLTLYCASTLSFSASTTSTMPLDTPSAPRILENTS